jgi:hypothetical protein
MKYTRTPTGIKCKFNGHTVTGASLAEVTRKMFVLMRVIK